MSDNKSLAEKVAELPEEERAELFKDYTEEQWRALEYDWGFWGRPTQSPPEGNWHIFLALCGRGWGKSRAGAEWIKEKAETPNIKILLLGRTASDVRDVMVAAILEVYPPESRPTYIPSKRRIEWANGTFAICASSESPDQLRGPQAHVAWTDELAALKTITDDSGANAWTNLLTCVRLGDNPQIFCTTTPKRTQMMKDLVADAANPKKRIEIITGSTFENATLSGLYIESMVSQYGNSELAKQELYGQMLGDSAGILFNDKMIDDATISRDEVPKLSLRFISVDPSVAERPRDECGIIAVGVSPERAIEKRTAYILEDYSLKGAPEVWAQRVVDAAKEQRTKFIVVEGNQGKQLLQMVINSIDPTLKIFLVNASTGKYKRAEPVAISLSQGRVKIVDNLPDLTDQMVFFDPEDTKTSPDRMDAMVHGVVAAIITPPQGLRAARQQITSSANRRLPSTGRSNRQRVTGSIRRK